MTKWQPWKTAPERKEFIATRKIQNSPELWVKVIVKWVHRDEIWPYGLCEKADIGDCECGAQFGNENYPPECDGIQHRELVSAWNHKPLTSFGFTHWMDLPNPPKDKSNG